jgi:hypothetical protein
VLVLWIRCLDRIALRLDLEHEIDNVPERNILRVGVVAASPADVETDTLLGDVADGAIDCLYPHLGELAVVRDAHLRVDVIPVRQVRVVELQGDARVRDSLVLLVHRIRYGEQHLLLRAVVLVAQPMLDGSRGECRQTELLNVDAGSRGLDVLDVSLVLLLPDVLQRAGAEHALLRRAAPALNPRSRQPAEGTAAEELREHLRLARCDGTVGWVLTRFQRPLLNPAEPAARVGLPTPLRVLAVVDDVDAVLGLQPDDLADSRFDPLLERRIERVAI